MLDSTPRSGTLETTDCEAGEYIRVPRYGPADYDSFAPVEPAESKFRHGVWAAGRRRLYESLVRVGAAGRRIANFTDCGNTLWLMRDGTVPVLACGKCHDRLCSPCQRERQDAVVEGVLLKCHDSGDSLRFVTLTLKHTDQPLAFQLDRLVASFKLLRQHPAIRGKMDGGVWFIETKLDASRTRWHPHLHIVVGGEFIKKKLLAETWYAVTGDSYIVDIRTIDDVARRARYVSKYSTKPLHPGVALVPAKLDEFVLAIKGRRLYQCFGSWAKAVDRSKLPKRKLARVGHVSVLHAAALAGEGEALYWMRIVHGRWPRLRRAYPLPAPAEPAGGPEEIATGGVPPDGS